MLEQRAHALEPLALDGTAGALPDPPDPAHGPIRTMSPHMALRLEVDRRMEAWRDGPGGRLALGAGIAAARSWRRALEGVTFVGITGTAGKTTAKELLLAATGSTLRITGNRAAA